MQTRSRL